MFTYFCTSTLLVLRDSQWALAPQLSSSLSVRVQRSVSVQMQWNLNSRHKDLLNLGHFRRVPALNPVGRLDLTATYREEISFGLFGLLKQVLLV